MLSTTNFEQLDQFFQKKFDVELRRVCESLTSLVSDSSKWNSESIDLTKLRMPGCALKFKEMVKLSIVHWYFPPEIRFLTRFWLEEHLIVEYQEVLEILLTSKEVAIGWLLVQEQWNDSDLWGNVLSPKKELLHWFKFPSVRLASKGPKAKRTERHRDYRDGKTRRTPHTPIFNKKTYLEEEDLEFLVVSQQLRKKVLLRKIVQHLELEKII